MFASIARRHDTQGLRRAMGWTRPGLLLGLLLRTGTLRTSTLLASALLACAPTAEPPGRVLVVGIDSANFRVIQPLLDQGRLPNLAQIAKEGASGPLQSFLPLHSPRIWNTIATGVIAQRHGILTFFHVEDGKRYLFHSTDRKVPAVWNIASSLGRSVGVVNWWTTYPPDVVNGVVISDHFLAAHTNALRRLMKLEDDETKSSLTYPAAWSERVERVTATAGHLTDIADPFADNSSLPRWSTLPPARGGHSYLSSVYYEDTAIARVTLDLADERHPDLLMVLFPGIDRISHVLWGVLEPEEAYNVNHRPSPVERASGKAAIERYYEFTDRLIGLLLADYDSDDTVIILSDHGFEAGLAMVGLTGEHETLRSSVGVIFARGPGIAPGSKSGKMKIHDVAPTILTALGIPVARDFDGNSAPFLAATLEPVESYQDIPIERLEATPSGVDEHLIENLRALGYGE